ncbi:MAG TPA: hypothetical protein VMW11_00710 [Candidatus Dormibacteraeota bacterium]|nr:hypothetical protein [Candidatus Dormibacteraeota bacterium]
MKRFVVGLMVAAMAAIGFGGVGALADPSNNWQLADGSAQGSAGIASLDFSVPDKTHLLYNSKDPSLLGALSGKTMTATFTVSGVTDGAAFTSSGTCGSTPATARLFFESIAPGAKFAYTNYWWADAPTASQVLANGTATITALVDPTAEPWSDWNGQPSSANTDAFNAAAANVTLVGLSFGGGCFFENGVGTSDGSGTLTLNTFTS